MENNQVQRSQHSVVSQSQNCRTFTTWKSKSSDVAEGFTKRELDILSSRHENQVIAQLPHEFFEGPDFKNRIAGWSSLVGVRDVPDVISLNFMAEYLMNEIGGLTLQEIEIALKMNMMLEFGDLVEHYQMFNVTYLAKIISLYKKHRLETEKKYTQSLHKLSIPKAIPFSDKQKDYNYLNLVMQDVVEPPVVMGFAADKWLWLQAVEWVKPNDAQFYQTLVTAAEVLQERALTAKDKSERKRIQDRLKDPDALEVEARSLLYREYLDFLRGDETLQQALCDHVAARYGETYADIVEVLKRGVSYQQSPLEGIGEPMGE